MRFAPYSHSKIGKHLTCPRSFKYRYIDRRPREDSNITALRKGRAVHSILENHPLPGKNTTPESEKIAKKFIGSDLGKYYFDKPSTREFSFGLGFDLSPGDYHGKDILFRGKIDNISTTGNILELTDWKTGKYRDLRWQDFSQLVEYSNYFFLKYEKVQNIKLSFVYVEYENLDNSITIPRCSLERNILELREKIRRIEEDYTFEKTRSRLCDYCDYQIFCLGDV